MPSPSALSNTDVARKFPPQGARRGSLLLITLALLAAVLYQSEQSLVGLCMTTNKSRKSVSFGGLIKLAGHRVNVGDINLHAAKVVGGQDAVSPRAAISQM